MVEKGEVSIEQGSVAYLEAGSGPATLVLIHGNSMAKECYLHQLESELTDAYRVIAIDLPGHGETKCSGKNHYTVPGVKSILKETIRKLDTGKCILLGHSLGGHIAIEAAGDMPDVCGVMAWGTPPLTYADTGQSPFNEHPAMALIFSDNLRESDIFTLSGAFWNKTSDPPAEIAEQIMNTDPGFRAALSESISSGEWEDELKAIASLNFPVALGIGENDELINRTYIQNVAEAYIWEKKLHIFPAAGHSPHMEHPDAFNTWVGEYGKQIG